MTDQKIDIKANDILEMSPELLPRSLKSKATQQQRSREMTEVFTQSWICNKQNNLVDNEWFGRECVYNTEVDNPDGIHTWIVNVAPITFPAR